MQTINILLADLIKKHGVEFGDSVGIKIFNQVGDEVFFLDCMQEEGIDLEWLEKSSNKVTKVEHTNDFYDTNLPFGSDEDDYIYKEGYYITMEVPGV